MSITQNLVMNFNMKTIAPLTSEDDMMKKILSIRKKAIQTVKASILEQEWDIISYMVTAKLKSPSLLEKAFDFFFVWKLMRTRNKAKRQLEQSVMVNLEMRCGIFKTQYNQRDLRLALREENYMEAARLRDIINQTT